jgi:serine protease Do/serine protease DegQ
MMLSLKQEEQPLFEKTLSTSKKPILPVLWVLTLLCVAFSPVQAALPAVTAEGDALPSLAPMLEKNLAGGGEYCH